MRPGLSADLLELILYDAVAAMEDGLFDERDDRHMSRTPLILDEAGWEELLDTLAVGSTTSRRFRRRARLAWPSPPRGHLRVGGDDGLRGSGDSPEEIRSWKAKAARKPKAKESQERLNRLRLSPARQV